MNKEKEAKKKINKPHLTCSKEAKQAVDDYFKDTVGTVLNFTPKYEITSDIVFAGIKALKDNPIQFSGSMSKAVLLDRDLNEIERK